MMGWSVLERELLVTRPLDLPFASVAVEEVELDFLGRLTVDLGRGLDLNLVDARKG